MTSLSIEERWREPDERPTSPVWRPGMRTASASPTAAVQVSFIVAARDVAPFVAEAVLSALGQTSCAIEVIVVDDASRDDTASIVAALARKDRRVRLLRFPERRGVAAARNAGMAAANGTWIAVLDGDDRITADRSAKLIEAATLWSADVVADNIEKFGDGVVGRPTVLPTGPRPYSFLLEPGEFIRSIRPMARTVNFGYLKPMFRRSFLAERGLSYREDLRIGEDSHLCVEALLAGARFLVGSEAAYLYRVRSGSSSWRLLLDDVDALESATRVIVEERPTMAPAVQEAVRAYLLSLERVRVILRVVDFAQRRRLAEALRLTLMKPVCWGFVVSVLAGRSRRLVRTPGRWRSA